MGGVVTTDDADELELVVSALAGGPTRFRDLCYHDRGMVRGRALAYLRERYRGEYEERLEVEARRLIVSGEVREW